jgi:hypothetical protein
MVGSKCAAIIKREACPSWALASAFRNQLTLSRSLAPSLATWHDERAKRSSGLPVGLKSEVHLARQPYRRPGSANREEGLPRSRFARLILSHSRLHFPVVPPGRPPRLARAGGDRSLSRWCDSAFSKTRPPQRVGAKGQSDCAAD